MCCAQPGEPGLLQWLWQVSPKLEGQQKTALRHQVCDFARGTIPSPSFEVDVPLPSFHNEVPQGIKSFSWIYKLPVFHQNMNKTRIFFFNEKKSEELDKTKKECKSSCTALLSPTVSSITAIPVILSVRKLSLVPSGLSGNYFGHHLWRFLSTVFPDPISFRLLSLLCLTRINTSPRMQKSLFLVGCSTSSVYCFTDTVYDTN